MKLMNKLLPFATLGCVAAVVTPLATSCGNNGFYSFDGSKFYVPSSDLAEMDKEHKDSGLPYTEKEATELYYKNIANNSDIFVEDLLFYLSSSMYEEKINAQQ